MISEIEQHRAEVIALCEKYEVLRLGVFGSAARSDFDEESSDVDMLILFDRRSGADYLVRYFGLVEALERLFGRHVDLVTEYSAHSPAFRAAIARDLVTIYERSDDATAA